MPRKGRGGTREGTPGSSYSNRTDLNKPKVVPMAAYRGQAYGARQATLNAQSAVPIQAPPGVPGGQAGGASTPAAAPTGPLPGSLGGLLDPTARPDEPLTHGLASGPGAGPEVLQNHPDPDIDNLRAIYRAHPTEALRSLLEGMGG